MFKRLKEIRSFQKLSQSEFAKSLGIGQSTLAMLEVGKREILDRHIKTICSIYNVNEEWLRTGEGEMFEQQQTFSLDEKAKQHNLSQLETDIIKNYMELPLETRKALLQMFGIKFPHHAEAVEAVIDPIEAELESYRKELEDEKRDKTLSALQNREETS